MLQALSIFTVGIIGVLFGMAVIYAAIKGTTRLTIWLEGKKEAE
jgi:hypothetical protein